MFELSDNLKVDTEVFQGSKIFTINNFYKNPDKISNYLFQNPAPLHRQYDNPTYNGVRFEDRRLKIYDKRLEPVIDFLCELSSQKPLVHDITTNQSRFYKHDFNDYKNCIWWPHVDKGYNGIVFFNKNDTECGTNLYSQTIDSSEKIYYNKVPEHSAPWRQKEKYQKIKTLTPKYNRLVLFDGLKFPHGMNIANDRYFSEEYRINQVFFFRPLRKLSSK
tara:strand:- start:363 stop:1019 length:657 start_codon:yes stop_codon:yes gene_type:complete